MKCKLFGTPVVTLWAMQRYQICMCGLSILTLSAHTPRQPKMQSGCGNQSEGEFKHVRTWHGQTPGCVDCIFFYDITAETPDKDE